MQKDIQRTLYVDTALVGWVSSDTFEGQRATFLAKLERLMRQYQIDFIQVGWSMPKPCKHCRGTPDDPDTSPHCT